MGRLPDGRACFVAGGIPGERVRVEVVEQRPRWTRARLVDVLTPSPERVVPRCELAAPGRCGGCQLQHVTPAAQAAWKRQVVIDQLERIGGIASPPVGDVVTTPVWGYRTTARLAVVPTDQDASVGAVGFRRAGSHEVEPVGTCPILAPELADALARLGSPPAGSAEVLVRSGDEGVTVLADGRHLSGPQALTVTVAGRPLRVSAASFFQPSPEGAAALVDLVRRFAAIDGGDSVWDLYAGVGLFAAALAADGALVTAVERSRSACADARHNLAGTGATVVEGDVAAVLDRSDVQPDVVVADPPRTGLEARVAEHIAAITRRRIVLVACDPAALARDAKALTARGWRLVEAVPVDQFPQTAQIEVVAAFARG